MKQRQQVKPLIFHLVISIERLFKQFEVYCGQQSTPKSLIKPNRSNNRDVCLYRLTLYQKKNRGGGCWRFLSPIESTHTAYIRTIHFSFLMQLSCSDNKKKTEQALELSEDQCIGRNGTKTDCYQSVSLPQFTLLQETNCAP